MHIVSTCQRWQAQQLPKQPRLLLHEQKEAEKSAQQGLACSSLLYQRCTTSNLLHRRALYQTKPAVRCCEQEHLRHWQELSKHATCARASITCLPPSVGQGLTRRPVHRQRAGRPAKTNNVRLSTFIANLVQWIGNTHTVWLPGLAAARKPGLVSCAWANTAASAESVQAQTH